MTYSSGSWYGQLASPRLTPCRHRNHGARITAGLGLSVFVIFHRADLSVLLAGIITAG